LTFEVIIVFSVLSGSAWNHFEKFSTAGVN